MSLHCGWIAGLPALHNLSGQKTVILMLQPLFEEANRMRRTLVLAARALDTAGLGIVLPDLPGMGEHPVRADTLSMAQISDSLAMLGHALAADGGRIFVAGFRAACIFDSVPQAVAHWRLAPETGDRLVRTLLRTEMAAESTESHAFVLGQPISREFLEEMSGALLPDHARLRTVRLSTDRAEADLHIDASALWRHAEPGEDPALAQRITDDIITWTKTCGAF